MAVEQRVKELHHFINGEQVEGSSGRYSNVYNPSTGEVIAQVPLATRDEVKHAIEVAKKHFQRGRNCPLVNGLKLF